VSGINAVFTPAPEEVETARRILAAYRDAPTGVVVVDDRLVEKPVILKMQHILAIAEAVQA